MKNTTKIDDKITKKSGTGGKKRMNNNTTKRLDDRSVETTLSQTTNYESKPLARREVVYVQGTARQGNKLRVQELQKIYGIGPAIANKACRACGILSSTFTGQLTTDQVRVLEK